MKRILKGHKIFKMSKDHKPVERCCSGETILFETNDCYNGQITSENLTEYHLQRNFSNPATGPLYIED